MFLAKNQPLIDSSAHVMIPALATLCQGITSLEPVSAFCRPDFVCIYAPDPRSMQNLSLSGFALWIQMPMLWFLLFVCFVLGAVHVFCIGQMQMSVIILVCGAVAG